MIAPRFLLCIIAALAMHTWPAHADALSDAFNQGATLGRSGNTVALHCAARGLVLRQPWPVHTLLGPCQCLRGRHRATSELCPAELQCGGFLADQSVAAADLQHRSQ